MNLSTIRATLGVMIFISASAHAEDDTGWIVKVGAHKVDPKSNNGQLVYASNNGQLLGPLGLKVGPDTEPTITAEYLLTQNWGIEALESVPFEHDISFVDPSYNGALKVGTVKEVPSTVSLQYHFNPGGTASPFIGLGVNYTWFFDENALNVGHSLGLAAHAGVDFNFANHWLATVDARWIDIDADATFDTAHIGRLHVDPLIYGFAIGYHFH